MQTQRPHDIQPEDEPIFCCRNLDVFTVHSHGPPSAPITAQWSARFNTTNNFFMSTSTVHLSIFKMHVFSFFSLLCKISVSAGHQKLFPCVPSLVHVPIPVCHLYMIRLWISSVVKLIVKETATRRATRSFPLPTLRPPSPVSTIQMLLTNSTTGMRGTIEMSAQEFATFLGYIYQHFSTHHFLLFKI